jgi:alcohol dehydrogenase class IV
MQRHGHLDRVKALLVAAGIEVHTFEAVPPEPPVSSVDDGREAACQVKADCIIGLGGGSALDVAKSAAVLLREAEPTQVFFEGKAISGTGIDHILIPTTFGTGTEVTPNAVLIDPENGVKKSIRHDTLRPGVALVDARLGMTAPVSVKAESGLDALTQAIEGYGSRFADDLTEPLSLGGTELLLKNLVSFVEEPENEAAAHACATGSLLAGMAFSNCRLGLIHGVVHPLGALTHLPHGRLCGLFLPHALRYNRESLGEKYEALSALAGDDIATVCEGLLDRLGVGRTLDLSLEAAVLDRIVTDSMPSGSLKANPRSVTEEDLTEMVLEVCGAPSQGGVGS